MAAAAQGDVDQGRPTGPSTPMACSARGQVSCARQQRPEPGAAGDASGLQQQCLHPRESQGVQGRRGPVGGPVALAQLAGESGEHLGGVARFEQVHQRRRLGKRAVQRVVLPVDDLQQLANPVWDLDAEELQHPAAGHIPRRGVR